MKILFATTNPAKINKYAGKLKEKGIEILTINDLEIKLHIEENGKDAIENAYIKAKAYYDATKKTTIGMDNNLFIEEFPKEKQPGTYVRRVNGKELTDEEILSVIVKQVKMRKDAISDFEKASRNDLIASYNEEIDILNEYLPKPLTIEEVNAIIDEAFKAVNPTSQSDMGKIMKEVSPKLKARADMGEVNKIIKNKLLNL